jgi:hypothetical protein
LKPRYTDYDRDNSAVSVIVLKMDLVSGNPQREDEWIC